MKYLFLVLILFTGCQSFGNNLTNYNEMSFFAVQSRGSKIECKFEKLIIPKDTVIYAAGSYSGRKTNFQIDQSGHIATQFDIAVNNKEHPVILILGAYEPTIWNIGWSVGTKIIAVFASGYHRQVVAGIEKNVPLLISSYDNNGDCGYHYVKEKNNISLNSISQRLFGKAIDVIYLGNKSGKILIGKLLTKSDTLVTSKNNTPDSYVDKTLPLAGKAGLDEAVAKGVIRKATVNDVNRWVEAVSVNLPKPKRPHIYNAYVVLKEFTYPAGLYGANSATFFIPKGVPIPKGNPGHSTIYDFNNLVCKGVICH